jgi:hypothetical protein
VWYKAFARVLLWLPQDVNAVCCHILCLVRELSRQWNQLVALQYMFDRKNLDKEMIENVRTLPLLPLWQTQRDCIKQCLDMLYSVTQCGLLPLCDELFIVHRLLAFIMQRGSPGDCIQCAVLMYHIQSRIYGASCNDDKNVLNVIGNGAKASPYSADFYWYVLQCLWIFADWGDIVRYWHRYTNCWYRVSLFDLLLCLVEALLQQPLDSQEYTQGYGTANDVLERIVKTIKTREGHDAAFVQHLSECKNSPYYRQVNNSAVLYVGSGLNFRIFGGATSKGYLILPSVKESQKQGVTVYSLVRDDDVNF